MSAVGLLRVLLRCWKSVGSDQSDWEGSRWKYRHRQWAQPWGEAGGVTESSCSWNLSPGAVRPGSVRIRAAADGALPTVF